MNEKFRQFLSLNFYQIYPRSFMDSNNDGTGDFLGIASKAGYLEELGINAIWISPCFKSPNVDSGYDISDYLSVGEEYGTLDDFRYMLETMHAHGIKVIVDLVVNHTSTEHEWFRQARTSRDNEYRDYYYWFDEKPNDWQSCFGGSAWEYHENTKQYYLHSFAIEQADLNWENPKVREEVKKIVDYWVDLGVDGFRCDVLDMISKDFAEGKNGNGPRLHEFIHEIFGRDNVRHLYTVGECWGTTGENLLNLVGGDRGELTTSFVGGNIVHSFPRFNLFDRIDYDNIHRHFAKMQTFFQENGLVFVPFFENHDGCRSVSRFAPDSLRYEAATFFATLLYTLSGTPFILQGEEFGTPDAWYDSIDYFDDVETVNYYNFNAGRTDEKELMYRINRDTRDNGRRPMAWNGGINGGFNDGAKPWLPIHNRVKEINLEEDLKSDKSVFGYYKKIISFRKNSNALIYGKFEDLTGERKDAFVYSRTYEREKLVVVCNYIEESEIFIPENYKKVVSNYPSEGGVSSETHGENGKKVKFRPFETAVYSVEE